MRKILKVLSILTLTMTLVLSILSISIPISASGIKIEPPKVEERLIYFKNDTLFLEAKYRIINDGIYDIEEFSLQISVFTLGNVLITTFKEGFPEKNIRIKAKETFEGKISLSFNLKDLEQKGVLNAIREDKAVKFEITSSGKYAFGFLAFKASYSDKVAFALPIEELKIYVAPETLLNPKSFINENGIINAIIPIKINYKGWLEITNMVIEGYAKHNDINLFNFSMKIPQLFPGNNSYDATIKISEKNLILLLTEDLKLKIAYTIKGDNIDMKDSLEFVSNRLITFEIKGFSIAMYNSTHVLLKINTVINSYLKSNLNTAILVKIYDNTNNSLLHEKTLNTVLNANSANEISLDLIIKRLQYGSVIRVELYMKEPINMENEPLISETFVLA